MNPQSLTKPKMEDTHGKHDSPRNAQYFANAGKEYMDKCAILPNQRQTIVLMSNADTARKPRTSQR